MTATTTTANDNIPDIFSIEQFYLFTKWTPANKEWEKISFKTLHFQFTTTLLLEVFDDYEMQNTWKK